MKHKVLRKIPNTIILQLTESFKAYYCKGVNCKYCDAMETCKWLDERNATLKKLVCPGCGKEFYPNKDTQFWCSRKCYNRIKVAAYRARIKEREGIV